MAYESYDVSIKRIFYHTPYDGVYGFRGMLSASVSAKQLKGATSHGGL